MNKEEIKQIWPCFRSIVWAFCWLLLMCSVTDSLPSWYQAIAFGDCWLDKANLKNVQKCVTLGASTETLVESIKGFNGRSDFADILILGGSLNELNFETEEDREKQIKRAARNRFPASRITIVSTLDIKETAKRFPGKRKSNQTIDGFHTTQEGLYWLLSRPRYAIFHHYISNAKLE